MKITKHSLIGIALALLVCLLCACSTVDITMTDAAVPEAGQSLIVVLAGDELVHQTIYIDGAEVSGSMLYISSGFHTVRFNVSSTSTEDSDFNTAAGRTTYTRTTYTSRIGLQIGEEFLPGHTYRLSVQNASNVSLEDITDSVDWYSPKRSVFAPKSGELTTWKKNGLFVKPAFNVGLYGQYTHQFDGKEAEILWYRSDDKIVYREKEVTGLSPFLGGLAFQGGLDFGYDKIGLATMAEINGGVGAGGEIHGMGYSFAGFNWGYLFVGELYYEGIIGLGLGYGKTSMVPSLFMTPRDESHIPAYEVLFPYYRAEVLLFPVGMPITLYTNYFFNQNKWSFGILGTLAPWRGSNWAANYLR